jgi:hypothetical protein
MNLRRSREAILDLPRLLEMSDQKTKLIVPTWAPGSTIVWKRSWEHPR